MKRPSRFGSYKLLVFSLLAPARSKYNPSPDEYPNVSKACSRVHGMTGTITHPDLPAVGRIILQIELA